MKLTHASNIGLHAMTYMVQEPDHQKVTIHQLADRMHVSPTYLAKILARLVKAGLITSVPGVKGGYCPEKDPKPITFADVIGALDGQPNFQDGLDDTNANCEIAATIKAAEGQMWQALKTKRLVDLDHL